MSIYDFEVKNIKGEMVSLNEYKGQVLLIVNSAIKCGFTPQYNELTEIYNEFKDEGFTILDFPCNQFGGQAPGSTEECILRPSRRSQASWRPRTIWRGPASESGQ